MSFIDYADLYDYLDDAVQEYQHRQQAVSDYCVDLRLRIASEPWKVSVGELSRLRLLQKRGRWLNPEAAAEIILPPLAGQEIHDGIVL